MVNRFYKWQFLCVLMFVCFLLSSFHKAGDVMKTAHPFYVSVTEINHNSKEKILEISCKLFLDDLEKTLTNINKTAVDLTNVKDKSKTGKMISDYLVKHLQLKVDGKPVALQYIGYEKEKEAAWCYLQVNNVTSVKQLEINNTLLFEEFDGQISIMHVTVNGTRKSLRLNKPDAVAKFVF